ncbi:MAG: hypothetical protein JWN49_114 [Parcubacteria group bacterium]|nr:hypothetical protein [Parcubacteria group bacterium]
MEHSRISLSSEQERDRHNEMTVRLAESLSQRVEPIPFTGIDPTEYELLKEDEANLPDLLTPIDERIQRFKEQGLKVVLGEHGDSKDIYVVPALSSNKKDRTLARHLQIVDGMDEELRRLILANQK